MRKIDKEGNEYHMQTNKRAIYWFALILIICIFMDGCSPANLELQEIKKGQQLIGIFVAFEEDLKDYMMQEGDTLYYQEKKLVRADGSIRKLTDQEIESFDTGFTEKGIKQADGSYTFGEIDGYYLGYDVNKEEIDGKMEEVSGSCSSPTVYSVNLIISALDEENNVTISGTIGVASDFIGILRVNNVYKRSDGSVYVQIPSHAGMYINENSSGGSISQSISESVQSTGFKKENIKESRTFTVTVEQADILESASIIQMNASNQIILETQATFELPESEFLLDDKTAYVIVEESLVNEKGQDYIKRTAYDCENIRGTKKEADPVIHTFHYIDKNDKIALVNVKFVR